MSNSTLEINIANRVAVVWMAREKVRNAFNEASIAELAQVFARLGADDSVRVIVLAGRGPAPPRLPSRRRRATRMTAM